MPVILGSKGDIMATILLKQKRTELGFSQEYLAEISGVSKAYISQIETGQRRPSIDVLCKLSKALNCDITELFKCQ
jgi:transcriptional regulator with XRE-family HTH domain